MRIIKTIDSIETKDHTFKFNIYTDEFCADIDEYKVCFSLEDIPYIKHPQNYAYPIIEEETVKDIQDAMDEIVETIEKELKEAGL